MGGAAVPGSMGSCTAEPGPAGRLEAQADLDALHRGNGHQQPGQPAVELAVPAHVAAEAHDHAARDHLDLAAQRVAGLLGLVDPADDLGLDLGVEHPDLGAVGRLVEGHGQLGRRGGAHAAQAHHVAADLDPELVEQPPGQGAGGHPRRGLPGAGALQDVAGVEAIVLEHAGQVGVPGTGTRHPAPAQLARLVGLVAHDVLPVGPVAVVDQHGDGRAQRLAGAHPGEPFDPVALDLHPGAPAVAHHPAGQVAVHPLRGDGQTGGEPFHDGDVALAVGLAGGGEAEMHGPWG